MTRLAEAIIIVSTLVGAAPLVVGHPMDIQTGTINWTADGLCLQISLDEHTLEHMHRQPMADASSEAVHARRHALIVLRDESGERLSPAIVGNRASEGIDLDYETEASRVSIALDVSHMQDGPRQLQLWVGDRDSPDRQLVQLTSGGNIEVIERGGVADPASRAARDRFSTPTLAIDIGEWGVSCQAVIPVNLLRAWRPFAGAVGDAVDGRWLSEYRAALEAWATSSFSLAGANSDGPESVGVALIGPDDLPLDTESARALNTAMARVLITLSYTAPQRESARARWTGFRPGLQRIECAVRKGGELIRRRTLNATQDTISLNQ